MQDEAASRNAFDSVAEYYELLSDSTARLDREGPLLLEWLNRAPGRRVVDLACGTGLHAEFLAAHGAEVAAFDLSADMVAHAAARRPHPRVAYAVGDMREVKGGPWDLALCLGNSLSLVGGRDDIVAVMRSVCAALAPGGLFAVQVLNYASEAARQPRHRVERRTHGETELVVAKSLIPHGEHTLLSIAFHVLSPSGYRSANETALLANLSCADLEHAAESAGFGLISFLGSFDGASYEQEHSPDLICLMQKD